MRKSRELRVGKHIHQKGADCLLVSWCIAGGYMYSERRRKDYAAWLRKFPLMSQGHAEAHEFDAAFGRFYDRYYAQYLARVPMRRPRRAMPVPKFTGRSGVLNMWSRGGMCHSVAVIRQDDGSYMLVDPGDARNHTYASYSSYIRAQRARPTLVTYVEVLAE